MALDALLKERHVTRAGERLHITQSAMSNLLKQLREIFEDELFIRGKASCMLPTARALALAEPVKIALDQAANVFAKPEKFNPKTAEHKFIIGMSDYAELIFLPELLQVITKQAPGIEITIKHINYLKSPLPFEDDAIDTAIGIYSAVPENLVAESLFKDESVCLGWRSNPILKKPLTLKTFANAQQIVILYHESRAELFSENFLKKQGLSRRVVATVPHTLAAIHSLPNTELIAPVLKRVAQKFAKKLPLAMQAIPFPYPEINVKLVWHPKNRNNSAHQWLRQQIKNIADKS